MRKQEFLTLLRKELSGLPQEDISERLTFYKEMIDDRIEEGLSEEEAVAAVGSVDEIVAQAVADTPLSKIAKDRIKSTRQLHGWEIILLILGAPIWLSLGIAAFAVILSLYISLWAVIISLWSVFASVAVSSIAVIAAGSIQWAFGDQLTGVAMIGAGIACAGLSIFVFFGCKAVTKGLLLLTRKTALGIKNRFIKKEAA